MKTIIKHAKIIRPDEILADGSIEIEGGRITAVHPSGEGSGSDAPANVIDAAGLTVAPGLIDIHIHGCMGADTMDADQAALARMSEFLVEHGVTSFYATTVTNSAENIAAALESILAYRDKLPGAALLGAHVEGPYINLAYKGAQNPAFFRTPDPAEYRAWIDKGVVKLATVAPELEGAGPFIEYCAAHGVELAVGHSQASFEQVIRAADMGLRQATHLFNGMQGLHHREPGTVGGALYDERIYAQIIVDGIHLHPAVVSLTIRLKGIGRTILITDAMRATGLQDGEYELGGQGVTVKDGAARIADGSLAGSTLTLDQALRNTMEFAGLDFRAAVQMATRVPAEAMRIADRKGRLDAGWDADLTFFDEQYQVAATMVAGRVKYQKQGKFGVQNVKTDR